jgi:hypothetical protein
MMRAALLEVYLTAAVALAPVLCAALMGWLLSPNRRWSTYRETEE